MGFTCVDCLSKQPGTEFWPMQFNHSVMIGDAPLGCGVSNENKHDPFPLISYIGGDDAPRSETQGPLLHDLPGAGSLARLLHRARWT